VRLREGHVRARTAASNQLGALLEAHWPGPKAVVFRLASPIALAFLTDYPTPQAAARLGQARMTSFCRRHSYRGGKTRPGVYFRWAANRRARKALTAFAHNARMQSPWAGRL
jgi:hypothetical protein